MVAYPGVAGVFDGEHHFEIETTERGSRLRNSERYSGVLSPLMQRLPAMKGADAGFAAMNDELRRRAEEVSSWPGRPIVLVVGRDAERMARAKRLLEGSGFGPSGASTDELAVARMQIDAPDAMIIGGGVEASSREKLRAAFAKARPGRPILEHVGELSGLPDAVRRAMER